MKNKIVTLISLSLIFLFLLSACHSSQPTEASSLPEGTTNPATPAETSMANENTAAGDCLVGTWNMSDFTTYFTSLQQNLSSMTNGDYTFSDSSITGNAQFIFNADQTTEFRGENFNESVTMSTKVGENTMDIPMTITINGSSSATYSVDGDKISISDQDNGDLVINIDIMGTPSTLDQGLLGQPGTTQLYQYSCTDPDTLSLKLIAIQNMDLAPLILTRAK